MEDKMPIEKLAASIQEIADTTGQSVWTVKDKLRRGVYRGRKSGRRTLVEFASVKEAWLNLPVAKFAPPRPRRRTAQSENQRI
jgi:hypothetical protein